MLVCYKFNNFLGDRMLSALHIKKLFPSIFYIFLLLNLNLTLSLNAFSATWENISKNENVEYSYDKDSIIGSAKNKEIYIKVNILKDPKEGDKSRLLRFLINCSTSTLLLDEIKRYSEFELKGVETVFKGNTTETTPKPNTVGQRYIDVACGASINNNSYASTTTTPPIQNNTPNASAPRAPSEIINSNSLPQTYTFIGNGFMSNFARCNVEVKVPGISPFDVLFQEQPFKFTFTIPPDQGNKNLKITYIGKFKFLANIQPCNFKGDIFLNEIIANEWKNERIAFIKNSSWANRYDNTISNVNYCLGVGFNHFGLNFSEDPPYDSSVLYPRPTEDKSRRIFQACNSIIDKQQYLENNVSCTINDRGNNIKTVCDKSLFTDSQGVKKVDFKQAVIALLNNEEVKIGTWETKQAEGKRLAQLEQERKALAAAEAQRLWRETPEGKKAQAQEDARLRKIALEEEAKERERKLANERYRKEREAKEKITAENCSKATSMSVGASEQMATALKVSVSGIRLLRTESFGSWCSAIVDTPKGIKRCKSEVMIKGNDVWVHFTPFLDCN
jgi:hypothetical protein